MGIEGPLASVTLTARLDGLSAFFAIVIVAIGAVTTVYAIGHTRDHRSFPGSGALYILFVLSMLAVVVAGDAFTFLLAWVFMGAGAIDHAVGTRDLEHLGGLLRRMPVTGAYFLVGSAAISALPPLNGFATEWLTFQSAPLARTGRGPAADRAAAARDAMPEPRLVIAVGACAVSGSPYPVGYASGAGASAVLPVDVLIPGCPPRPEAINEGLLAAMGKMNV